MTFILNKFEIKKKNFLESLPKIVSNKTESRYYCYDHVKCRGVISLHFNFEAMPIFRTIQVKIFPKHFFVVGFLLHIFLTEKVCRQYRNDWNRNIYFCNNWYLIFYWSKWYDTQIPTYKFRFSIFLFLIFFY